MRRYRTSFRLWAISALGVWAAYLTVDHFTSNGYGIVWHADDLVGAWREGQEITALIPNARAFFILPFLKSVAVALALGWLVHAAGVVLGLRLGRRPDLTLAADYDDKRELARGRPARR
jgi:hypothetical protein